MGNIDNVCRDHETCWKRAIQLPDQLINKTLPTSTKQVIYCKREEHRATAIGLTKCDRAHKKTNHVSSKKVHLIMVHTRHHIPGGASSDSSVREDPSDESLRSSFNTSEMMSEMSSFCRELPWASSLFRDYWSKETDSLSVAKVEQLVVTFCCPTVPGFLAFPRGFLPGWELLNVDATSAPVQSPEASIRTSHFLLAIIK